MRKKETPKIKQVFYWSITGEEYFAQVELTNNAAYIKKMKKKELEDFCKDNKIKPIEVMK